MASLTPQTQQLIARYWPGSPLTVYKPKSSLVGWIIVSLFVTAFWAAFTIFCAYITSHWYHAPEGFVLLWLVMSLSLLYSVVLSFNGTRQAIRISRSSAVLCMYGVVLDLSNSAGAFRWEEALTVTLAISVSRGVVAHPNGGFTPIASSNQTYTVHCRDGRKFYFDSGTFGEQVQQLGETLQVEVARWNQLRGWHP